MKISIIIPNYNGALLLEKNLLKVADIISKSKYDYEIIIADDNSTDNSLKIINEIKSKNQSINLKVIESPKNKGFSSNVNLGVDNAEGDILILLNTDVIPSRNFLDKLIPHFDDERVFAVGCLDESVENGEVIERGRGKGAWMRGLLHHSAAKIESGNTLWVSGGSGAFRRRIWEEIGGLDTLYDPFYWEDIDISYRAKKAGYITLFEKKSVVRHEHEKGSIKSRYSQKDIKKIAYRNQFIFAWKNSDFDTLIFSIIWVPYHLLKAIVRRDSALLIGFIDAIEKLPKIINSRKSAQKLFVLKDKEVTSKI